MTMPRHDLWTVTALKPKDIAAFDAKVPQPFQRTSRNRMGGAGQSELLYEVLPSKKAAEAYATLVREAGGTSVTVRPPRPDVFQGD